MTSDAQRPAPPGALSPLRILAALCLIAPFVAVLWIPSYNSAGNTLLGFPFFYWYQLLWVIITAVLLLIAYWAVQRDNAARRGFAPATPSAAPGSAAPAASSPAGTPAAGPDNIDTGATANLDEGGDGTGTATGTDGDGTGEGSA